MFAVRTMSVEETAEIMGDIMENINDKIYEMLSINDKIYDMLSEVYNMDDVPDKAKSIIGDVMLMLPLPD